MTKKIILDILFISVLSSLLFGFGINKIGLTDPDETFYAETAKEMLSHHSFFTPLIFEKPQFEKPPLTYWLIMSSFSIFGINEKSARLPMVIFGIIGVVATYIFSLFVFNRKIAIFSSLILATSLLYLGSVCIILTDMIFSVFIALSLYSFFLGYLKKKYQIIFWDFSYIFLAFAVLTKGPLAIIIVGLTIFAFVVLNKEVSILKKLFYPQGLIIFSIICLPWYLFMTFKYGKDFLYGFFIHENLGRFFIAEHKHNDHLYYYPLVIFLGIFPWSFWLFFLKNRVSEFLKEFSFLKSWFWTPFLFFLIAKSKLPSYVLPLSFPLAILLGISISNLKKSIKLKIVSLLSIIFLIPLFIASAKLQVQFPDLYKIFFYLLIGFSLIYITGNIFLWFSKYKTAFGLNIVAILFFVIGGLNFLIPKLEGDFSNKNLNSIISKYKVAQTIVCNKMYVRGVYYYTQRPVVVLSYERHPFYTPHPLKIIVTDKEIKDFFSKRDAVICVIKQGDLEELDRIFKGKRINKILGGEENRFIVLSKKIL
jgi:4-amino-4-deoxy-L-arabinose transferase-like glycosyltransferase